MATHRRRRIRRIGILTGGGDCPGLNAVIRGVSKAAMLEHGISVVGFQDGFYGLVEGVYRELDFMSVSGILTVGGTILGTSNIANPFRHPEKNEKGELVLRDRSDRAVDTFKRLKCDALVTIGGDGTQSIAYRLMKKGIPVVGVPKTIDNDLSNTDVTFGFDTAVQTAVEAIDKIHTTAMSHHRVMLVEVMGRYAGWIALHAGVASGSDVILIPEIPYDIEKVCEFVLQRSRVGKRFSIVCVAEGARAKRGKMVVAKMVKESTDPIRLGGVGNVVGEQITQCTGLETRVCVLSHIQRGGTPSAFDRALATMFGTHAMQLIARRRFGRMVSFKNWKVTDVTMLSAVKEQKLVKRNDQMVRSAKAVGTCFGD
ncbi:MAG TPA: ATP-dependent 6-phosphofructokinase [Planctomycetota bacterium]|nr:ATP-dependent 6-phosphofructokinase [Planctomycetota bacterium]